MAMPTSTVVDGKSIDQWYRERCSTCHGELGKADTDLARSALVRPQSFGDVAFQARATDEEIRTAILRGGQAVGKSPTMPANPDFASRPEVLRGLVAKVRSFQQ